MVMPTLPNIVQYNKDNMITWSFGSQTCLKVLNAMAIFPVLDQECPFSKNLFEKENIVILR